jgi:HAD superfamily hydrolase (TIGR01509 family)
VTVPQGLRAVIFDFDGVLADTEPLHLAVYQEMVAARGATLTREDYYARYLGFDDEGVFRALGEACDWGLGEPDVAELVVEKARRVDAALARADVLFPGAADCVRRLAAVPLAIASGALRPEIERVLSRAGLRPLFAAVVAAGDAPRGKPAPDPYVRAAALLGVPPASCVAIEDSRWGIESAKGAGLRCVGVTHTYPARELEGAHLVVRSLDDITSDLLRSL